MANRLFAMLQSYSKKSTKFTVLFICSFTFAGSGTIILDPGKKVPDLCGSGSATLKSRVITETLLAIAGKEKSSVVEPNTFFWIRILNYKNNLLLKKFLISLVSELLINILT